MQRAQYLVSSFVDDLVKTPFGVGLNVRFHKGTFESIATLIEFLLRRPSRDLTK